MPTLRIELSHTIKFVLSNFIITSLSFIAHAKSGAAKKQLIGLLPLLVLPFFLAVSAKSQDPTPVYVKTYAAGGTAFMVVNGHFVPYPGAQVMVHIKTHIIKNDYTRILASLKTVMVTADSSGHFETTFPCHVSTPTYNGTHIDMSAQIVGSTAGASGFGGGNPNCNAQSNAYINVLGAISDPANEPDRQNYGESCSVGKPVNIANGNMWLRQTDYHLPGVGENIKVDRYYTSLDQQAGLFGFGWTSDYDESISFKYAGYNVSYIILKTGDGRSFYFPHIGYGYYDAATPGFYGYFLQNPDQTWNLYSKRGTLKFSASGKLLWKQDRKGNQTTLTYNGSGNLTGVTDAFGRTLTFTPNSNGTIAGISDSIGTIAAYEYYPNTTLLKTVTYPDGSKYKFEYDSTTASGKTLLKTVKDALDNVLETHDYDSSGRATTSGVGTNQGTDGAFEKYTLDYSQINAANPYTTVTDALGRTTKYYFNKSKGRSAVTKIEGNCSCGGGAEVTTYEYDERLNLTKKVDALSKQTVYTYDEYSNLLSMTDDLGTETYTVNFYYGEVLTRTDRMNGVTTNTYDANGNLLTTKDPLNNTTTLTYTVKGQIATVKDARNNTTTLTYDTQGRLTQVKDANNKTTNYAYDARARLTGATNALNQTTNLEYDLNNRLKKVIYPDTKFVEFTYDSVGRRTKIKDARGNETNFAYDNAYRLTSVTDALNHTKTFSYDLMSNLTSQTDALSNTTNYEYDNFDRLKKVIYPPATTGATRLEERIEYDAVGNVKKRIDTANRETLYDYDTAHRLIKTTDALNKITQFEYNARSQMTKVKDALNQEYIFTYDALGRNLSQTRASSTMSYEYDAVGNRTKRTDYTGRVTDYTYDILNRLTQISYVNQSSANASYSYDDLSRLTSATNNAGTVSFTYDNRNRLKTLTDVFSHIIEYGYDENGNRNLLKFDNVNYATYAYDVANRLTSITNSSDSANITFGYDNADRLTSKVLPNGITTSYSYDGLSRLTRLKDETTSTVLFDRQLSYNAANQISQILEPSLTRNFAYDNVDRLTGVTNGSSATIESYAFNEVGSRTGSHLSSSYTYQSNNRLTATQAASYGYNSNGVMTSKTASSVTTNYTWDYDNRMTSASDGTTTVNYEYDALGRRTKRTQGASVTKFIYDGLDVLVDDNAGTLTKYLNGLGIDSKLRVQTGSNVNYFLTDHLGSTNGLADSTGSLTASTSYDSFGNATNSSFPTRYQFTGREFDSFTGLHYYRARWYDTQLGRFISEDPIGFNGGDINLYGYVRNNAANLRDPSGEIPPLIMGGIILGGIILTSPEWVNAPGPGDPVYRPENPVIFNAAGGAACSFVINRFAAPLISRFLSGTGDDIIELGISQGPTRVGADTPEIIYRGGNTVRVGDLKPLHSPSTSGPRPALERLTDSQLLDSVKNPMNNDPLRINTLTGNVVDGNGRAYELLRRADDPASSIVPNTRVPYVSHTPDNSMFP